MLTSLAINSLQYLLLFGAPAAEAVVSLCMAGWRDRWLARACVRQRLVVPRLDDGFVLSLRPLFGCCRIQLDPHDVEVN
jgi:hypothetical protein